MSLTFSLDIKNLNSLSTPYRMYSQTNNFILFRKFLSLSTKEFNEELNSVQIIMVFARMAFPLF